MDLTIPLAPPVFRQRTVDSVCVLSQMFETRDRLRRLPFVGNGDNTFAVAKDILEFLVMLGKLFDLPVFTFRKAYPDSFKVPLPWSLLVGTEP